MKTLTAWTLAYALTFGAFLLIEQSDLSSVSLYGEWSCKSEPYTQTTRTVCKRNDGGRRP